MLFIIVITIIAGFLFVIIILFITGFLFTIIVVVIQDLLLLMRRLQTVGEVLLEAAEHRSVPP